MLDQVSECIDILTKEIEKANKLDSVEGSKEKLQGMIFGLEIARSKLTQYWEENC